MITGINYWMPLWYSMKKLQLEAGVVQFKYFQPQHMFAQFT